MTKLVSTLLSTLIVLTAPGFGSYQVVAQVHTQTGTVTPVMPVTAVNSPHTNINLMPAVSGDVIPAALESAIPGFAGQTVLSPQDQTSVSMNEQTAIQSSVSEENGESAAGKLHSMSGAVQQSMQQGNAEGANGEMQKGYDGAAVKKTAGNDAVTVNAAVPVATPVVEESNAKMSEAAAEETSSAQSVESAPVTEAQKENPGKPRISKEAVNAVVRGAVSIGLGIYAGLNVGTLAGLAGVMALWRPAGIIGFLGGGIIGEKIFHTTEEKTLAAALWGGVVGAVAGSATGWYLGAYISSPWAAAGLAAVGVLNGLMTYVFGGGKQFNPPAPKKTSTPLNSLLNNMSRSGQNLNPLDPKDSAYRYTTMAVFFLGAAMMFGSILLRDSIGMAGMLAGFAAGYALEEVAVRMSRRYQEAQRNQPGTTSSLLNEINRSGQGLKAMGSQNNAQAALVLSLIGIVVMFGGIIYLPKVMGPIGIFVAMFAGLALMRLADRVRNQKS